MKTIDKVLQVMRVNGDLSFNEISEMIDCDLLELSETLRELTESENLIYEDKKYYYISPLMSWITILNAAKSYGIKTGSFENMNDAIQEM